MAGPSVYVENFSTQRISRTTRDELIFVVKGREKFCLCDRHGHISSWTILSYTPELNYARAYIAENFTSHTNEKNAGNCLKTGIMFHLGFIGCILKMAFIGEELKLFICQMNLVRGLEQGNVK